MDKKKNETPKENTSGASKTTVSKIWDTMAKIAHVIKVICKWIYNLRGIWMAVPVALVALRLAAWNMARLPEEVGINLLANGEYQYLISRSLAVTAPLVLTAGCLVMVLFSRRTIYPWIISIFSLVLPLLIWATNIFAV